MKTVTSLCDLSLRGISSILLSLCFITSHYAQINDFPTNQLPNVNQRQRFVAVKRQSVDEFELIIKSTNVDAFANLKPTELETQAFLLINELRQEKKIEPLKLDLGMLYIARAHSAEMAEFNYFSHQGKDGSMADLRAIKAGIIDWQGIGENIAFSQNAENKVQLAVRGWVNSAHHRENLLNPIWTKSGVGIAVTSDHKFYITQVFRE